MKSAGYLYGVATKAATRQIEFDPLRGGAGWAIDVGGHDTRVVSKQSVSMVYAERIFAVLALRHNIAPIAAG